MLQRQRLSVYLESNEHIFGHALDGQVLDIGLDIDARETAVISSERPNKRCRRINLTFRKD